MEQIVGSDAEDTALLQKMAIEARSYIEAFHWCPPITNFNLAFGVGGVVGLFLVEFDRNVSGTDDRLWVVTGDLPSAYFVLEDGENLGETLERYCVLIWDWAETVLTSGDLAKVFPVAAEASKNNARALKSRVNSLRELIIPQAAVIDA